MTNMYTTTLNNQVLVGTYQDLVKVINESGLLGGVIYKLKNQQT